MLFTLPFLAERHYLHGTTLLDSLLEHVDFPHKFVFKIEKAIFSNTVEVSETSDKHSAMLSFGDRVLFVTEKPMTTPVLRESVDEKVLVSRLEKQKKRFVLPLDAILPVRGMVMAFKHILLKYYPVPQSPGHWAFICLDAVHFPRSNACSYLMVEKVFCRDRMAFCSVFFDKIPAATCYFAWANF